MRLLFAGFPHCSSYRGSLPGTTQEWSASEERDVPEATGRYLLDTYRGAFLAAGSTLPTPAVQAEVIPEAPWNRALQAPTSRWGDEGPLPDDKKVKPTPMRRRG